MCKVLIIPQIKPKTIKNAWEFIEKITPKLSTGNNDGLGYAAYDNEWNIFSEKWLKNYQAYNSGMWQDEDIFLVDFLGYENIKESPGYETHGIVKRNEMQSIILHARKATCGISLENVHPFIKKDTALIHNGMIYNHEKLKKELSTCDSETILHEYIDYNVMEDPEQIHGVTETIQGYYACAILSKDSEGTPILDIFKSSSANLFCTYVNELETVVFSTSKYDLEDTIKGLNWKLNMVFEFSDDVYIRFNLLTGKKITTFPIESNEDKKVVELPAKSSSNYNNKRNNDDDDKSLQALIEKYSDDINWQELIDEEYEERMALNKLV